MFISRQPIEIYGSKSDINGMFSLFSKIFIRKVSFIGDFSWLSIVVTIKAEFNTRYIILN